MSDEGKTGLSRAAAPTAEDVTRVDREIAVFNAAAAGDKVVIFEGRLRDLAEGLSRRYKASGNPEWIDLLGRVSEATSLMAAEDISSIVDEYLVESPAAHVLRQSRYGTFAGEFLPDPSIYTDVDRDGCRIVVACDRFQLNGSGHPIFEGTMELLTADMTIAEIFEIATGGGAASHRIRNGPLPPGRYGATRFRIRDVKGMISHGVGYSINLDPIEGTAVHGRDAFRIHPDGPPFGTLGCVGVQGDAATQRLAREMLRQMVAGTNDAIRLKLSISYTQ